MNTEKITYKGSGNFNLPGIIWLPDEIGAKCPKAIVQITHG